jgi:hypothetical protein
MTETQTDRLTDLLKTHGYGLRYCAMGVKLRVLPSGRWNKGYDLPWQFHDIESAARHLIPVICDPAYTEAVCGR